MKPTVHDIARSAGVSLATVDRVLNGRPGVRHITRERVEKAISSLGYVRDVAAANLAKGRTYSFVFVLPNYDNSFMIGIRDEVHAAISRSGAERTQIRIVEVPPFDAAALADALNRIIPDRPDGVAFVAVEGAEVHAAVAGLKDAGIAVVTLVSDLPGSERDHFAGIDNHAAGRTAANLLGRFTGGRNGRIAVIAGSMLVRDHRERLEGFLAVMGESFARLDVLPVMEARDNPALTAEVVSAALRRYPDIIGLYSLGAGNRGMVHALREVAREARPVVVAHELTGTTRAALAEDLIDAVLNQDAGHEVRSAIRVLKGKVEGLSVIAAQERIRIDIFLKDNMP
ncbi:LacI family DNA-binding transcriptional regulator [Aliirhizobium cellulosilyticum]|jgi:LacI family transcriptional regulator|uniref:LacI family transcriptional regulator n=1 Tax=Aliirhizobium cellulosilyticum TaxID=393664 RepID=A0A7W6Y0C3_9HYPH|nr:LacI family DNA-binding transcriptional regulator [Rhizobium cellulosilyticum]MBB4346636.1 LacI family transcriptional regulator [Rhizobium cellulosilyticum]MBB4410970.1 LacI family transcriptional regulator [Rhizobium cellulosilyticum]MBB4445658.1 LacI family transcriptional regulator [Rhizobium cellulosilyticum]